jgi:hypothetical protein
VISTDVENKMKIFNTKNLIAGISGVMLTLTLSVPVVTFAGQDNGKFTGFEQGEHKGHTDGKGKHKGFENERNPWHDFYNNSGVEFDLTVKDVSQGALNEYVITVNSTTVISDFLMEQLGSEDIEGFYLQECMVIFTRRGLESDCEGDEEPIPLDSSLTMEEAGILDDPEVYLVFIPD